MSTEEVDVDSTDVKIIDSPPTTNSFEDTGNTTPPPTNRNSFMRNEGERNTISQKVEKMAQPGDWTQQWDEAFSIISNDFPPLNVVVCTADLVSTSFMSKHVVYTVKTEPLGYAVRRRYNDFCWLRDSLVSRYIGLYVPSLPATSAIQFTGKQDVNGDYVKNRMAQLNLFIQQTSKIPFFRTDPAWIQFLSIQSDKEFEALIKIPIEVATASSTADASSNAGLAAWQSMLERNTVNIEADKVIQDIRKQLDALTRVLANVDKDCRNTGKKAMMTATGMDSLSVNIANWNAAEIELLDPSKNECVNANGDRLKLHLAAIVHGGSQLAQTLSIIPKILARVLMPSIQFQLVQIEGFRQFLAAREQCLKDLDRADRERVQALAEKTRAAASGTSPKRGSMTSLFVKKTDELEENLRKKTELVKQLSNNANNMTKGVVFCEIARFHKERTNNIAFLIASLATINLHVSQAAVSKWTEIMALSSVELMAQGIDLSVVMNSAIDDGEAVFGDV